MKSLTTSFLSNLLTTLFIIIFVIAYMLIGYITLDEESRRMPILTGFVTLLLLALDIFIGIRSRNRQIEQDHDMIGVSFLREIQAILYVGALAMGIYLAGFLTALPLYLVAAMYFQGRQSLKLALLVALPASVAIYVVFELFLELQLFTGILFS